MSTRTMAWITSRVTSRTRALPLAGNRVAKVNSRAVRAWAVT